MSDAHAGEIAVQERTGTSFGGRIRNEIPAVAAKFLLERRYVVIAGRDGADRMWTTMLVGSPGFARAADPQTMAVAARPLATDPLAPLVTHGGEVGTIALDHHRRMRVNGILTPEHDGFRVSTRQVFSNCGRYIAERHLLQRPDDAEPAGTKPVVTKPVVTTGSELTAEQMAAIGAADTFFIGTSHPDGPADASHRGGNPGFFRVDSPGSCSWPDYNGNALFMTLGNITLNPRVGLLFVDWANGGMLQVSGRAQINWDESEARSRPGAERVVELTVDAVQETRQALHAHWGAALLSRYNPT
ncbi:MAG: pyridoxamine 5'-phosphate oxidase family protein [Microbacteriaceae bacterium]